MTSEHAIEIIGLVKEYDSGRVKRLLGVALGTAASAAIRRPLENISLTVPRGQRLGIVGGNGSGKTTLLRCIAGILAPTKGTVVVHGSPFYASGFGSALSKGMTVYENLRVIAAISGVSNAHVEKVIARVLEDADLSDYKTTRVAELSNGMVSRLSFFSLMGMREVGPNDILLLDEATSLAGDESFRERARETVARRMSGGATVVMVSHSLGSLAESCDRVIWLKDGEICMDGEPQSVIDAYRLAAVSLRK
jgi:ABC-type polysaccharide/polyol phosphate transport system ATPase subunit